MNLYSCLFTARGRAIIILDRCWSGSFGGYMVGVDGFVHSHPVGLVITISIVAAKTKQTLVLISRLNSTSLLWLISNISN